jgi:LacI family transcriptional regulator
MFNNRVDGLIVSLTAENNQPDYFRRFTEKHVPIVYFDRIPAKKMLPACVPINFDAAYKATQHLIEKGCRRLLPITISSHRMFTLIAVRGSKLLLKMRMYSFNLVHAGT